MTRDEHLDQTPDWHSAL